MEYHFKNKIGLVSLSKTNHEFKDFRRSEAVRAFCHREKPEQGVKTQKLPFDKHLWQKYLGKFP